MTDLIKTPVGTVVFGHPTRKDNYDKHSLGVEFNGAEVKEILAQLKSMQDAYVQLNPKLKPAAFWNFGKDENGDPVKDKAVLVFKSGYPAHVFDSGNNRVTKELNIGRGTKVIIAFKPKPQEAKGEAHIARYMQSIKVVDLVEYENNPFSDDTTSGSFVNGGTFDFTHDKEPATNLPPVDDEIPF